MKFRFRKCEREELHQIVEELYKKVPQSLPTLVLLETYINYSCINKNVYVPEEPLYNSLIVVTNVFDEDPRPSISVYWDPANLVKEELRNFLKNVPEWDWKQEFCLYCIMEPLCQNMIEIISEESFFGKAPQSASGRGHLMTLSEQNMKNFRLPEGYKLGKLHPHHVPYVLSTWRYACYIQGHEQIIKFKEQIEILPSVAIFKEEDEMRTCNPVSFILLNEFGQAGMLYTSEEHKRKGLAAVVETELAKKLLEKGQMMYVFVEDDNEVSLKLHDKIGFVRVGREGGFYMALKGVQT